MQPADYLVHFSNILLPVVSCATCCGCGGSVAAALTNIPYFLVQATVFAARALASVFTAINLYQYRAHLLERRPVVLSATNRSSTTWRSLAAAARFSVARARANGRTAWPARRCVAIGEPAERICIADLGEVEVRTPGARVGRLAPGPASWARRSCYGSPSAVDASFVARDVTSVAAAGAARVPGQEPDLRLALLQLASRDLAGSSSRRSPSR